MTITRRNLLQSAPALLATAPAMAMASEPPAPVDPIEEHARAIADHLRANGMTCAVVVTAEYCMVDLMHNRPRTLRQIAHEFGHALEQLEPRSTWKESMIALAAHVEGRNR